MVGDSFCFHDFVVFGFYNCFLNQISQHEPEGANEIYVAGPFPYKQRFFTDIGRIQISLYFRYRMNYIYSL